MAKTKIKAHWLVPTTMSASLAAGIALSVGHHCFYASLHGQQVEDARWPQQTNTSIGTAFAFLVRAACVIAISAAYWQLFWQRLQRPLALSTVDNLASQLKILYQLLNWRNLKASPLLAGIAVIAWLIPLAVIFPPAALKVVSGPFEQQELVKSQVPDFEKYTSFASSWGPSTDSKRQAMTNGPGPSSGWAGPLGQIRRSVFGTAYQAQIPMLPDLKRGMSYNLDFVGPSVQCGPMVDKKQVLADLYKAGLPCVGPVYNASRMGCNVTGANPFFLSWVAGPVYGEINNTAGGTVPFPEGSIFNGSVGLLDPDSIATDPSQPTALFFAWRKNMTLDQAEGPLDFLNCTLYNSTYHVSFSQDNQQDIEVKSLQLESPVTMVEPDSFRYAGTESLGQNPPVVQSYLAVMQAFGDLLVGSVYRASPDVTDRTHIFETDLAFTDELFPLYKHLENTSTPLKPLRPLPSMIEELFQNVTLSLFNVPDVLAPQSKDTSVLALGTHNIYHYSQLRLWSAYGAAIAATLLAVAVGIYSLAATGASYSNTFSTVVRVSQNRRIDNLIDESDRLGQDPLPKYIGDAKFSIGKVRTGEKADGEISSVESERESLRWRNFGVDTSYSKVGTVRTELI